VVRQGRDRVGSASSRWAEAVGGLLNSVNGVERPVQKVLQPFEALRLERPPTAGAVIQSRETNVRDQSEAEIFNCRSKSTAHCQTRQIPQSSKVTQYAVRYSNLLVPATSAAPAGTNG
jgi:hypothetical protein